MTTHLIFDELVGIVLQIHECYKSHTIVDIPGVIRNGLVSRSFCRANSRVWHSQRMQASYKIKEAFKIRWCTSHVTTQLIFSELIGTVLEIRVCCNSHTSVDIIGIMQRSCVSRPVCRTNSRVWRSQKAQALYKINDAPKIWWRTPYMTTFLILDELVDIVLEIRVCCESQTIVDILCILQFGTKLSPSTAHASAQ